MAIVLEYDKREIDPITATVLLTRGDDWKLTADIVDRYARYREGIDMTGASASAYFEDEAGNASAFPAVVSVALAGRVQIDVPASSTSTLAVADLGLTNYVIVEHPDLGTFTARSVQLIQIVDRGFNQA